MIVIDSGYHSSDYSSKVSATIKKNYWSMTDDDVIGVRLTMTKMVGCGGVDGD